MSTPDFKVSCISFTMTLRTPTEWRDLNIELPIDNSGVIVVATAVARASVIFFSFSLTWDPMRARISKRYSSHNRSQIVSKISSEFWSPNILTKLLFQIFDIWILTTFFFSLTWTIWRGNFQKLLFPQIVTIFFFKLLNFCLNNLHRVTFSDFWNIDLLRYYETEILTWESMENLWNLECLENGWRS